MATMMTSTAAPRRRRRPGTVELLVALACFAVLSAAALSRPLVLQEPDDYAYRASITALIEGHVVLSEAQYEDLAGRLRQEDAAEGLTGSRGISQWTQLEDGRWVSEKNPGYPFLAAPFAAAGVVRLTPLFYGGLACLALFAGGRRWLGAWGGTYAVGVFCSSGAALTFAWRAWMPTFTGAALVAAGAGALLWAVLAGDAAPRGRTIAGLLGFIALAAATLVRYTDVIALVVAVAAVLLVWRFAPGRLPRRALAWWLGSVVLAGALVLIWNAAVYGDATATGYADGLITFSLGAVAGNLEHMPWMLVQTVPASLLALAGLVWMVARSIRLRRTSPPDEVRPSRAAAHRDLAVAAALATAWWAVWILYFTYTWTADMGSGTAGPGGMPSPGASGGPGMTGPETGAPELGGGAGPAGADNPVHLVRFFVPALGPIALLAAWPLVRLPRWAGVTAVAALFGLGLWSYADMASADARGGIMGGVPGAPGGTAGGTPPAAPGEPPPSGGP